MRKKRKNKQPEQKMSPEDAYEFCNDLDLPDGAFWAMVEELSGATPDEFVN